jgi:hypothetical protein
MKTIARKRKQRPMTTNLDKWLQIEERLDSLANGSKDVKTRICIQCAENISQRLKRKESELESEINLFRSTSKPSVVTKDSSVSLQTKDLSSEITNLKNELQKATETLQTAHSEYQKVLRLEKEAFAASHLRKEAFTASRLRKECLWPQ